MVLRSLKYYLPLILFVSCSGSKELSKSSSLPDTNNSMLLNGYYAYYDQEYGNGDYHVKFFYDDGVVFYFQIWGEYYRENKVDSLLRDQSFLERERANKMNWGIFKITNSQIIIEKWEYKQRRPTNLKTYEYYGVLEKDNTISINKVRNNYWKKDFELDRSFKFHEFSPKPDSTNTFVY